MRRALIFLLSVCGFAVASVSWAVVSDYVVKPGDTLLTISKAQLGDSNRWPEIAQLNKIGPPYRVEVGQTLKIPTTLPLKLRSQGTAIASELEQGKVPRFPSWAWIWIALSLLVLWLLGSICIRWACWFSLVQTYFGKCSFLALLLAVLTLFCVGSLIAIRYYGVKEEGEDIVTTSAIAATAAIYLVGSMILAKLILQCKWRSVFTIFMMATVVANLLSAVVLVSLAYLLPDALSTQAAQDFLSTLVRGS